jgi:hypothetical protein
MDDTALSRRSTVRGDHAEGDFMAISRARGRGVDRQA